MFIDFLQLYFNFRCFVFYFLALFTGVLFSDFILSLFDKPCFSVLFEYRVLEGLTKLLRGYTFDEYFKEKKAAYYSKYKKK